MSDIPEVSLADKQVETPNRRKYVLRSMLIPGYGQWEEGNKIKGATYLGIGAILGLNYMNSLQKFKNDQSAYSSQIAFPAQFDEGDTLLINFALFQPRRTSLIGSEKNIQLSFGLLLGFWFYNVLDSYFFKNIETQWFQFTFAPKSVYSATDRQQMAMIPGGNRMEMEYSLQTYFKF